MGENASSSESHPKKQGLLKDQVRLAKRKDSDRYKIVPIQESLSFEKGFFVVIRACQLLAQKNDGIILVGLAGPSGAGKTMFTEKIINFMPSVAVISMDNYNDASRIVDGNFDDPRLTDYDTLLKNVQDLKAGKSAEVPVYDFKSSSRTGYRTVEVPESRIVIIEGIYALSEKLRPLLDLRISVRGGIHFDLVKRVLRDIQRAGQEPEEIIHQISETVYPMYKAFIEPDLQTAHIKIINKFNPFTGFQNPTYILKSARNVDVDNIKAVLSEGHTETTEQTYDIYLLPPGEDPESCQSYLRMRNKEGKYNLMFEVQGRDRLSVRSVAEQLGLEGSYIPRTYIEQIQLEKLVDEVMALPDDLKNKLSLDDDLVSSPKEALLRASADRVLAMRNKTLSGMSHSYSTQGDKSYSKLAAFSNGNRRYEDRNSEPQAMLANQGVMTQLSEQMTSLNDRMDDFTSQLEELNTKLTVMNNSPSQHNISVQGDTSNGSAPTSYFVSGLSNGNLTGSKQLSHSSSFSQLAKDSPLLEEIVRGQRQIMHKLDSFTSLLHEATAERSKQARKGDKLTMADMNTIGVPLVLSMAIGGIGLLLFRSFHNRG
ncbi:Inorganic pyrophosphatase TTM2 [Linum grandiflorum]